MMLIYPKRWKVLSAFVVAAGMSVGTSGSVQAGEYCVDSCCEPSSVFSNAGDLLSSRFKSICGLWKNDSCVDDCVDTCLQDTCLSDKCVGDSCVDYCQNPWTFGGWASAGYHSRSDGMSNYRPDRINSHQNWLFVEKAADGSQGWDWGARFDIMYGTDAAFTQSYGNSGSSWDYNAGDATFAPILNRNQGYGWALPQAYLEVAKGDFSVIAGHFLSPLGYESAAAPDNFFYSQTLSRHFATPFTHTGILATQQVSDRVEAYYGWTLGWDTGFDQNSGGSNFLGGAKFQLTDNTSLSYITSFGDLGWIGTGYSHSIVLDHTFGSCNQWNYVFQTDYVDANEYGGPARWPGPLSALSTESYGINQYLIYNVNDKLGVGGRLEWWRLYSQDAFSLTAGLNIKPLDNLTIRPEVRYHFASSPYSVIYNNLIANDDVYDSFVFGIDAILVF